MTRFAKHPDRNLRSLSHEAVGAALADAQIEPTEVDFVAYGHAAAGVLTGQDVIRAQTALAGGRILSRRSTYSHSRRSRRLAGPLSGRA